MLELDIERLAYGGDGIGHTPDGRTVFVRGACTGDRVAARQLEDRGRFVKAVVEEVISPSPSRVKPECPYFGSCGGCNWQHVAYPLQLTEKRLAVVDAFKRIGHIPAAEDLVAETVPAIRQYGYRNKVEFVLDPTAEKPRLGFHMSGSDVVVPVDRCALLSPDRSAAPAALNGALRYLSGDSNLGLTRVGLRSAEYTKDIEIALWGAPGPFPRSAAARILSSALPATSIVRVLSKGGVKERHASSVEVLMGKGMWRERLLGNAMAVSAPSFFQVNTRMAESLIRLVIDSLQPDGTDRVLDLYAGAGTFTLPLARLAGETVAVESSGAAIRDLRRNLDHSGLDAEVIGGAAERELGSLGRFDLVVVDPPRSGLTDVMIERLAATKPRRLAYVSCDPATLARDAALLTTAGLVLTEATPVDLFPQTYHIETVALFNLA
jgi:23S rRNA (uracil1939-C5)-methyltransferase